MNKSDIIELAKSLTYSEFMDQYCNYQLCPSIYDLKDAETKQECNTIDCTLCWKKALRGIKFRDNKDIDAEMINDMMDEL